MSLEDLTQNYSRHHRQPGENRSARLERPPPLARGRKPCSFSAVGYDQSLEEIVNGALFRFDQRVEMVIVKDISCTRLCETSHAALIGQGACCLLSQRAKSLVCSKVGRIVDMLPGVARFSET